MSLKQFSDKDFKGYAMKFFQVHYIKIFVILIPISHLIFLSLGYSNTFTGALPI